MFHSMSVFRLNLFENYKQSCKNFNLYNMCFIFQFYEIILVNCKEEFWGKWYFAPKTDANIHLEEIVHFMCNEI